jgi:hypothetical protein
VPRYTDRYVEYMESFGNAASTDPAPKRSSFFELEVDEPQTFKQAVESRYAEQWLPAFKAEYDSQIKNKSWVLISKSHVPTECAILLHKWVGKYKPGYGDPLQPDFVAPRFKGKLTVVGCHQQYGVDYEETYAPVPRLDSIRSVLSLTASLGYKSFQFDVATAFLNADVDKPIFMTQPEGFVVSGKEDHVPASMSLLVKYFFPTIFFDRTPTYWYNIILLLCCDKVGVKFFFIFPINDYYQK